MKLPLKYFLILCSICISDVIGAQDLSGNWEGRFSLKGSKRIWSFELELEQDQSQIKGIGQQIERTKNQSKNINSSFSIEGSFAGRQLEYDMKEILTLKSSNGQCLSHCEYEFIESTSRYQFVGTCNRNGIFYKKGKYYPNHSSCKKQSTTQVVLQKGKNIMGRKTEMVESLTVNDSKIRINIWDNNRVDGDIISLNLNGEWILQDYQLTNELKTLEINLPEEVNELILFAENMGTIPPNTAAISVSSQNRIVKEIILNSDEGKSEGVRIIKNKQ